MNYSQNESLNGMISLNLFENFSLTYSSKVHGWLTAIVCFLGIVLNVFNVIFLYRSKLASCSANTILISIAFCDSVIMAVYLPFSVIIYILHLNQNYMIYSASSQLICSTFHAMSVWLTVYLSVYRYVYMKESVSFLQSKKIKKETNTIEKFVLFNSNKIILIICLFCVVFCSPTYVYTAFEFEFEKKVLQINESSVIYSLSDESNLVKKKIFKKYLFEFCFYLQAILGKIVPSICLVVFIFLILRFLVIIKQNKTQLSKGYLNVSRK